MRLFSKDGLPLKILVQHDEHTYQKDDGSLTTVAGWLVRINGKKYPRDSFDEGDYSYRYTCATKDRAIQFALEEGKFV